MAIVTVASCTLLSCSSCGAQYLAENQPRSGFLPDGERDERLKEFMQRHAACAPREIMQVTR